MIGISPAGRSDYCAMHSANKARPGTYEVNAREYGAAVATAIGAGQLLAQAGSATVSLSGKGLDAMASALNAGLDGAQHLGRGVVDAGEAVLDAIQDGASEVLDAGEAVLDVIHQGANEVVDVLGSIEQTAVSTVRMVGDNLSSAANTVEDVVDDIGQGISSATDTVGSYLGLAAAVAGNLLIDIA